MYLAYIYIYIYLAHICILHIYISCIHIHLHINIYIYIDSRGETAGRRSNSGCGWVYEVYGCGPASHTYTPHLTGVNYRTSTSKHLTAAGWRA